MRRLFYSVPEFIELANSYLPEVRLFGKFEIVGFL